jgi:hypothetical protein
MATHRRLWHSWRRQLRQLLPDIRKTRVDGLALLVLGLIWSGQVALTQIAAALPLAVDDASTERRLRRWVANEQVAVAAIWRALLPALLRQYPGPRPLFVFDPTPHQGRFTVLTLGLVVHRRVMPVAWRLTPQQQVWPERMGPLLRELLETVTAALAPGTEPTLLVDRGITSAAMVDLSRALGWHVVFRVNAGPRQTNRVRLGAADEQRVWALVTAPGQRWTGVVDLFKEAGWRRLHLTIWWERTAAEPWILLSDEPGGVARVRDYRRRTRCEATYLDCKSRGWNVEATKLKAGDRLNRLLLGLHLAFWWSHQLGLQVIRSGQRHRYDRRDRRDLSVIKLGWRAFKERVLQARPPALLFAFRHDQWRLTVFP